jgi:hypothetical protein
MIGDIISQLQQSRMPPPAAVKKWLEIALVKKMGVISLPYHFWHGDNKINPASKHLLWAAILAEDHENFTIVEGIIHTEYLAVSKNPELQNNRHRKDSPVGRTVISYVDELLALSSEPAFRKLLTDKEKKILPPAGYPEAI